MPQTYPDRFIQGGLSLEQEFLQLVVYSDKALCFEMFFDSLFIMGLFEYVLDSVVHDKKLTGGPAALVSGEITQMTSTGFIDRMALRKGIVIGKVFCDAVFFFAGRTEFSYKAL